MRADDFLAAADSLPPQASYRPLPTLPFDAVRAIDEANKPAVMLRQGALLDQRYDLSDQPIAGIMMSGGRRFSATMPTMRAPVW